MTSIAVLYLIPNELAEGTHSKVIPQEVLDVVASIDYIWCEDLRTTRRYLSKLLQGQRKIETYTLLPLTKETTPIQLQEQLSDIPSTVTTIGVISDAGCPGIADPGALAVDWAHRNGIQVKPLVGPSSILLCLMASGLNGQSFTFHGYLPIDASERKKKIKSIESESSRLSQTQLFMETPYRNDKLLEDLLLTLHPDSLLTIATDITDIEQEFIKTKTVGQWRKLSLNIGKRPTMFALMGKK
ncbi:MAG: SAM-dependent methyltransferase [Cytophagaceae bacterium]|jgi:16S rRNA (cytidine1402-2'-O)-methyltransferase|nr:SAM-dependent methyltransferase [Cytophagaceae bacterium]